MSAIRKTNYAADAISEQLERAFERIAKLWVDGQYEMNPRVRAKFEKVSGDLHLFRTQVEDMIAASAP